MKYLRNKRTGRVVVFDESLLALGTYEEVEPEKPADKPKSKKAKPSPTDELINAGDQISVVLHRDSDV